MPVTELYRKDRLCSFFPCLSNKQFIDSTVSSLVWISCSRKQSIHVLLYLGQTVKYGIICEILCRHHFGTPVELHGRSCRFAEVLETFGLFTYFSSKGNHAYVINHFVA